MGPRVKKFGSRRLGWILLSLAGLSSPGSSAPGRLGPTDWEGLLARAQGRVLRLQGNQARLEAKLQSALPAELQALRRAQGRERVLLEYAELEVAKLRGRLAGAPQGGELPVASVSPSPVSTQAPPMPPDLGPLPEGLWQAASRGGSRATRAVVEHLARGTGGFPRRMDLACAWIQIGRDKGFDWTQADPWRACASVEGKAHQAQEAP